MFSAIRRRLTYANVGMTVVLVFAMSGGALAASKFVITSTKQIKPSVLKQLSGKAGAPGPAGPTGPAGAPGAGTPGPQGPVGSNGANGESVTSAALKPKEGGCTEGGSKFTVGGKETTACNGAKGAAGAPGAIHPGEKLPTGASETGTWATVSLQDGGFALGLVSMSFTVPLATSLEESHIHYIPAELWEGILGGGSGEFCNGQSGSELTACEKAAEEIKKECPGTEAEPQAKAGSLCVYVKSDSIEPNFELVEVNGGAGVVLALVNIHERVLQSAYGTWAVTAS
jgi:hypothetical protein